MIATVKQKIVDICIANVRIHRDLHWQFAQRGDLKTADVHFRLAKRWLRHGHEMLAS